MRAFAVLLALLLAFPAFAAFAPFMAVTNPAATGVPINTTVPTITASPIVGSTLTAGNGSWANSPIGFAYQWNGNGTPIGGATSGTYVPVTGDIGDTVTVTASNAFGVGLPATSSATSAVIVAAPVNTVAPVISGLSPPQVGSALTSSTGFWTNSPTGYTYQWSANGSAISGATASAYTPITAQIADTLTVTVTATNGGGSTPATSTATSAVIANAGSVTFTALHTFYLSPTGSGTTCSQASPCANTTARATVCGDVWVALNGTTYNPTNFDPTETGTEEWGTVGTCPSRTGGIDGLGGINAAVVMCQSYLGCSFSVAANTTKYDMYVDQSHWSIQGFDFTNPTGDGAGGCLGFGPTSASVTTVAYVSAINNRAANCPLLGIGSGGYPGVNTIGVDEQAYIGNIIFNAAQSADFCGSGLPINIPSNFDAAAGTHVFITQNFSYGNINGVCGANSNFQGNYTTATSAAAINATTITLGSTTKATAGWPVDAYLNSSAVASSGAIPQPTLSTGVTTGTTIGLSSTIVSPGVPSGTLVAVGTSTDGEGINFDTWAQNSFTGKTVVKNNIIWHNGNAGWEVFCAGTCASGLSISFYNNTVYGNVQDYKHDGPGWDVYLNQSTGTFALSMMSNIIQSSVTKPAGSTTNGAIGQAGTGEPVNALATGLAGYTITGNYIIAAAGATCAPNATCDSTNSIAQFGGGTYTTGNTFLNPGLTAPGSLPTTLISCTGQTNSVACAIAAGIVSNVAPTIASTTLGYQPSTTCRPDADYPAFLKGLNYLSINISTGVITENSGLSSKPCGL
jgi:hypothetical protein